MSEEVNRQHELREQIRELQEELYPLEIKEKQTSNAALVGRCFKYNNSYGGGDRWWKYARVIDAGDHWPVAIAFQHTTRDSIEIEVNKCFMRLDGWQEIPEAEYRAAWQALMQGVAKMAHTAQC